MVIDSQTQVPRAGCVKLERAEYYALVLPSPQTLFLFGGWDGLRDLSDFWSYDIASNTWTLISPNTEADGGPR